MLWQYLRHIKILPAFYRISRQRGWTALKGASSSTHFKCFDHELLDLAIYKWVLQEGGWSCWNEIWCWQTNSVNQGWGERDNGFLPGSSRTWVLSTREVVNKVIADFLKKGKRPFPFAGNLPGGKGSWSDGPIYLRKLWHLSAQRAECASQSTVDNRFSRVSSFYSRDRFDKMREVYCWLQASSMEIQCKWLWFGSEDPDKKGSKGCQWYTWLWWPSIHNSKYLE